MKKILLAEDDGVIASGLVYALEQEGCCAAHCATATAAYTAIASEHYDLATLDVQLPDGTGFEIAEKLWDVGTAVIFLTVVDDESKIVSALERGAADYITKPFRLRELLARVRRTLNTDSGNILTMGGVRIDRSAGQAYIGSEPLELTALEYRLLLVFAENQSRLMTRSQILESIWDCGGNFVEDNTLTVYIKRLREKLGDAVHIETVRGLGYRVDK